MAIIIPPQTRRLTRAEAKRLGVSYTAKRRVSKDIKKVTRKTKLYTDRQVAQAKLGTTKEKYTAFRISKPNKQGVITYRDVKRTEHFTIQKKVGNRQCQIVAYGAFKKKKTKGGSGHNAVEQGEQPFARSFGFEGGELRRNLDALYSPEGWLGFNEANPPNRVDVLVYGY